MAVTPDDIAVELGRVTPAVDSPQFAQWQKWIDRAYMLIQERAARLGVDYSTLDVATVDDVVAMAVAKRALVPLDGADSSTRQVAVDDASMSETRSYRSGKVDLPFFDDWWDRLGLASGTRVRSIRLSASSPTTAQTLPTP